MAQSFLDIPGLPLGLRNNNPGNLRPLPGGVKWQGEISADLVHNFSRFSDVAYGLRAMITDITGDIVIDGKNTIRKLVTAYAPPSENNTTAYIAAVCNYTGWQPDRIIKASQDTIQSLIRAKLKVELGATSANKITNSDLSTAFSRLSPKTKALLKMNGSSATGAFTILALIGIGYLALSKNQ